VGGNPARCADKCSRSGCFGFFLALARARLDLSLSIVVDLYGMDARHIIHNRNQWKPSRRPNLIEGEPNPGAAGLMRGFYFVDVASYFHAGREHATVGHGQWLKGMGTKSIVSLRIFCIQIVPEAY
jgi:hypothetical protein